MKKLSIALKIALAAASIAGFNPGLKAADPEDPTKPAPITEPIPAVTDAETPPEPPPMEPFFRVRRHRRGDFGDNGSDLVRIGSDAVVREGEEKRSVVVVRGGAKIDGRVRENVVVVGGNTAVDGRIERHLVAVLGSVHLGTNAQIGGNLVAIGSSAEIPPEAIVLGNRVILDPDKTPAVRHVMDWVMFGALLGRPLPHQVGWAWGVASVFLLINILVALMFPRTVQNCVDTVSRKPIVSIFSGLLVVILLGPLLFLLTISIVGIVVIPFLLCALIASFFLGKVTLYRYAGEQFGQQMHLSALHAPLIAVIAGTLLFYILYMVPFVGFLVWTVITLWGVGAVTTAAMSGLKREQPAVAMAIPGAAAAAIFPGAPPAAEVPGTPGSIAPETATLSAPLPGTTLPTEPAYRDRAGFWLRLIATLLDGVLIFPLAAVLHVFVLPLWIIYHVAMWTWKGTTIGGIVLGIKVLRIDGRPINFAVALVRSLSSIFSLIVLALGFFWAGWSREKRSWHDKIAGTVIVKVPKGMSLL